MTPRRHTLIPVLLVLLAFAATLIVPSASAQPPTPTKRATGKPTALKVTVTKVELWNGTAWFSAFTGTAQLDMVAGGTFPGIADLSLPAGTYSKMRITAVNTFVAAGSLAYNSTTYYMTSAAGPGPGTAAASTSAASAGEFGFHNPTWGDVDKPFTLPEFNIGPITVSPSTNYQPTLKFDVTNALELYEMPLEPASTPTANDLVPSFYFVLGVPIVSIT